MYGTSTLNLPAVPLPVRHVSAGMWRRHRINKKRWRYRELVGEVRWMRGDDERFDWSQGSKETIGNSTKEIGNLTLR